MIYQFMTDDPTASTSIIRINTEESTRTYIPNDQGNTDWNIYQEWLAADPENNIPLPAE